MGWQLRLSLHCLSALTPFGTKNLNFNTEFIASLHCLSALTPFGTFNCSAKQFYMTKASPLPIGTYPFRDRRPLLIKRSIPFFSIAYRHLPLSGLLHGARRSHGCRVSIAYRHLPLSGLTRTKSSSRQSLSLHCLSALTPFGTLADGLHNATIERSPLPIGTYPFRDSVLPDLKPLMERVSIAYRHLPLSGLRWM